MFKNLLLIATITLSLHAQKQFAPTVTLVLQAEGKAKYFHLESRKSLAVAATNEPVAYVKRDTRGWQLIIENIYNYSTEPKEGQRLWTEMSADEIAKPAGLAAVPFERKGFYSLDAKKLPAVILIPQWGLLQISSFDERTDSAISQYKRVVTVTTK
jgi:hypothetical protein